MRRILGALIWLALTVAGAIGAVPSIPAVGSNAELAALNTTDAPNGLQRCGYLVSGDSPCLTMLAGVSACSLSSFIGTVTTSVVPTTQLNITNAASGTLRPGLALPGGIFAPGTVITKQISGTPGKVGIYSVSQQFSPPPSFSLTVSGDGASQVPSADGKCWLAQKSSSGFDARQFGADPTGTSDSLAALSAADGVTGSTIYLTTGTYNLTANFTGGASNQWVIFPGVTFTGTGTFAGGTGSIRLGNTSDPRLAAFGPATLIIGSLGGNQNVLVASSVKSDTSPGFPSAIIGQGRLASAGFSQGSIYAEAMLDTNGLSEGMEIDCLSAVTPQTVLPFARGPNGAITENLCVDLTLGAETRSGYSFNSSAALEIASNGAKFVYGVVVDVNSIQSGGLGLAIAAPSLIGDPTLTSTILYIKGGTGANDGQGGQIELTNTSSGVTAPNKFLRINGANSNLEVVNSNYTGTIWGLDDTGVMTLSAAPKFSTSTTGAGTQTFTNSPCGTLTSERWIPITITGQTGTWNIPACQ